MDGAFAGINLSSARSLISTLVGLCQLCSILGLVFAFLTTGWCGRYVANTAAGVEENDHENWCLSCLVCVVMWFVAVMNMCINIILFLCAAAMGFLIIVATALGSVAALFAAICNTGLAVMVSICPLLATLMKWSWITENDTPDWLKAEIFCDCAVNTTESGECSTGWTAKSAFQSTCDNSTDLANGGLSMTLGSWLAMCCLMWMFGNMVANKVFLH